MPPVGEVSETYNDGARAADDCDWRREVVAQWALLVPWCIKYYPGPVRVTPDTDERA